MSENTILCNVCEGAAKVAANDTGEPIRCPNAACVAGWVNVLCCRYCTGIGCVPCQDSGLESERREYAQSLVSKSGEAA